MSDEEELRSCWRDVRATPHARTYRGVRSIRTGTCEVKVVVGKARPKNLPKCLNVMRHSPTGFEWGYSGSGPAQLALALLVDALGDRDRAVKLHQAYKARVVGVLPQNEWTLTQIEILEVVKQLEDRLPG